MRKVIKLIGSFVLVDIIISIGLFLFTMTILKLVGAYWKIYNPFSNPFMPICFIITTLVMLIPGIGFNWQYLDEQSQRKEAPDE